MLLDSIKTHKEQKITLERLVKTGGTKRYGIANGRLSDRVFGYVVDSIRTGKYPPGFRITERAISRELDMSHVPVREAMEKLIEQGWVERVPQKGVYVKSVNGDELREIYQLREALETAAVRILARQINENQLSELKAICNLLASASEANNAEVFKDADTHFHRMIVSFINNQRMKNIFDSVVLQAGCFFFIGATGIEMYKQRVREHLEPVSHQAIYEALANHDGISAEALVRGHIAAGLSMITELRDILGLSLKHEK
jgi:DNA-binding GntR family transcriptional regulator